MRQMKPAGLLEVERKLTWEKEYWRRVGGGVFAEDANAAEERLRRIRRQWAKVKNRPLIQQMSQIVESHVEAFFADFYDIDIEMLLKDNFQHPFVWWVRDSGTELFFIGTTEEEIEKTCQYLDSIRRTANGGHDRILDSFKHRFYVGEPAANRLTVMNSFIEIKDYVVQCARVALV